MILSKWNNQINYPTNVFISILVIYGVSQDFIGKFAICSVCGKQKLIEKQRTQLRKDQVRHDVYLECKDCASIPLWDTKRVFDHYQ